MSSQKGKAALVRPERGLPSAELSGNSETNVSEGRRSAQRARPNGATFAAFPVRMIGDQRCTTIHFRVTGALAIHDRLSGHRQSGKQGQGCWASHKTLAQVAGVHITNLSTALGELHKWGYITAERHPMNKRTRIYRIIYETLPEDQVSPAPTDSHPLPVDKVSDSGAATTLCPEHSNREQDQSGSAVEYIPLKREDTLQKQEEIRQKPENILQKQEINSGEPAPPQSGGGGWRTLIADNPGGALALKERQLRTGDTLQPDERALIEEILLADFGDPISQQAKRILEKWGGEIG